MQALFPELADEIDAGVDTRPATPSRVELPHPIPYQGSKRLLAPRILAYAQGRSFRCLYEPFAGSAAMTIAAAHLELAMRFVIGDSLAPLMHIWQLVLTAPGELADDYERLWLGQAGAGRDYYTRIRAEFNRSHNPAQLLYLLARCVKNSPRFNRVGEFNQSEDRRRLGMRPRKMRYQIEGASALLRGRAVAACGDFEETMAEATAEDLVYLDPPYEGISTGTDRRYHQGLQRDRLIRALGDLNRRHVPFLLSYDGRCGDKTYGPDLPASLDAVRIELNAGRSSQATLNGRDDVTVESLYVSRSLLRQREPSMIVTAAF